MSIFIKRIARGAAIAALTAAFSVGASSLSDRVDSLSNTVDGLEDKVRSTLMSGGSHPISFSGEARLKAQYHNLGFDAPYYMQADRSYLQSGWEGNENLFRLGMVVSPGRNLVLWSKIGFQHTLTGNRHYQPGTYGAPDGYSLYQYRQDKARNSITIHEDMSAGIAVRTVPASFWVRMGNTMWTEASPLTVWKAQPRTFAWEYLPFEVEQPIARYYEYNIAKGEKSGRAAWNKKPFNGINVESINLPYDFYANFVYGTFERFDNFEREYIDFAGDLAYADGGGDDAMFPEKGHGVGDSYRHVIHARLAKGKMFGDMTLGLNYVGVDYKNDVKFAYKGPEGDGAYLLLTEFRGYDSIFVKEPSIYSIDLKGPITDKFSIHADFALSRVDTVWMIDTVSARQNNSGYAARVSCPDCYEYSEVTSSDFIPAAFLKLNYNGFLPTELDLAYIGKGFYSPFSFATPIDAFYAFGSNMLGAGKFVARGEGSPYVQNMMGANITLNPKLPGYGHLRLKYGQHMNITDDGRDLLFFPYRLNGSDMFTFFHSSFNRWGNGLLDNSVKSLNAPHKFYKGRLGDESFVGMASWNDMTLGGAIAGPGAGGLRSDFLAMFEGFVPYRDSMEAYLNWRSKHAESYFRRDPLTPFTPANPELSTITNRSLFHRSVDEVIWVRDSTDEWGMIHAINDTTWRDSMYTQSSWVPTSKKYTFNLELDAAYDIGPFVRYNKDLFVGGYFGINGVTRSSFSLLETSETGKNTLLWSAYLRLEPAIALHKSFYLLGLFGYENWRSDKSWMMVERRPSRIVDGVETGGQVIGVLTPVERPTTDRTISARNFVKVPIDYRDIAWGLGFDWDMLERVGLHGRAKWTKHVDKGYNDMLDKWEKEGRYENADGEELNYFDRAKAGTNDWSTWIVSLEIKTWF